MKRFYSFLILAALVAISFTQTASAAVNPFQQACATGGSDSAICTSSHASPTNPISDILVKATHIVAIVGGAAAVIIIIISGFRFVSSQGEAEAAAKARQSVINAAIGLVVIVLAQAIITFVIGSIFH